MAFPSGATSPAAGGAPAPAPRSGTSTIRALDGLRGIAILMVVLYHGIESFVPADGKLIPIAGVDLAHPLLSGWMGVNLFFVLSGYLITWHLLRRWKRTPEPPEIRTYLVKRWLRIVPTYYVVLIVAALGLVPHHPLDPRLMGLQVGWHALFLQDYLPSSILGPFWSLGVEEKFYLAMPVVLLLAWRMPRLAGRIGLLAVVAAIPLAVRLAVAAGATGPLGEDFLDHWRNPFHLNLDALFLGSICAWLHLERDRFPVLRGDGPARLAMWADAVLVACLALVPGAIGERGAFDAVAIFPLTAIGMALVLFGAALRTSGAGRFLESRLLARAGRIAYPWYLTHVLVLHWLLGELWLRWPGSRALAPATQVAIFLPIFLIVSIGVATALHLAVEKPCLVLKDRVGVRRTAPSPATGTA